jgi:hypothetical protein
MSVFSLPLTSFDSFCFLSGTGPGPKVEAIFKPASLTEELEGHRPRIERLNEVRDYVDRWRIMNPEEVGDGDSQGGFIHIQNTESRLQRLFESRQDRRRR